LVVCAIAEAMFSEDGEVDGARFDALVVEVDAFVSAASRTTRLGLRVALLFVRLSPILLFFRWALLDRLPLAERVTLLSRLERSTWSNLSLAFIGWRTVLTLVFYEDEAELRQLGYGPARERYKRALPMMATPTPLPVESGVRLRESDAPSAEEQVASNQQEVA
jgi:hypothetical protein